DGTVKVLDFGLAKLAEPAAVAGTATVTQSPNDHDARDDDGGRDPRDGRVHVARTSEGKAGRQAKRYLGLRVRGVRDDDRQFRLRGRRYLRHAGLYPYARAGWAPVAS